jgi:hypothetical protein
MSSNTTQNADSVIDGYDIQGEDQTDIRTTVKNIVADKRRDRENRADLKIEGVVRELTTTVQNVLAVDENAASLLLDELHYTLREDADVGRIIDHRDDILTREDGANLSAGEAKKTRAAWKRYCDLRDRGQHPSDPEAEFVTIEYVAKALGYLNAVSDPNPYAPVTLERIDEPGHKSDKELRPLGRRRLKKNTRQTTEKAAYEIPHQSCDHILAVALPRRGKDSTLTSIGKNLHEQHGYKYFSIYDDGRMETPMLAIPNGEKAIHQNLYRLDQEPDAFDAEVMVPAVDLPGQLPSNFRPFTIGIDDLTPWTVLKLGGVNGDKTTEFRIHEALRETLDRSGNVPDLVSRLRAKAGELDAVVTWTEEREQGSGSGVQTFEAPCEMRADRALEKAANQIARLAGEGLLAGRDAATNIDMERMIANNEKATVLCCNFLGQGRETLKYLIIDLWLQLIFQTVDDNSRLPRVCLEIRELKALAPSKNADVRWKDAVKDLKQTLFFLSTQGGSRRILLLGSTQKLNDVYKSIRTNMATKVLLQLGEEEIDTLDDSYNLRPEQKRQLKEFGIGKGMIISSEGMVWPVELRGAPCGLGDGDRHWLDQYATAFGARVREEKLKHEPDQIKAQDRQWRYKHSAAEWWVEVPTGKVSTMQNTPNIGVPYSTWYLLSTDFPDDFDALDPENTETIPESTIREVLRERRPYPLKTDLMIRDVDIDEMQRDILTTPRNVNEEQRNRDVAEYFDIPPAARPWLKKSRAKRRKFVAAIEAIDENDPEDLPTLTAIHKQIEWDEGGYSRQVFGDYAAKDDELRPCLNKNDDGNYVLSETGEDALAVDWDAVDAELRGDDE